MIAFYAHCISGARPRHLSLDARIDIYKVAFMQPKASQFGMKHSLAAI
jgi:hypothetical protein